MQILQMRTILKFNGYTTTHYLLDCLNWLCVNNLIFFNTRVLIFNFSRNMLPQYFNDIAIKNFDIHNCNTGSKYNI